MTARSIIEEYDDIIKDAQVVCAMRGHMDEGEYLDPSLWEALRLRLLAAAAQRINDLQADLDKMKGFFPHIFPEPTTGK